MIVFCSAKKENILVPNAVEKHRTGAFRTRDQTLSFFFQPKKKDNHYENESMMVHCFKDHSLQQQDATPTQCDSSPSQLEASFINIGRCSYVHIINRDDLSCTTV